MSRLFLILAVLIMTFTAPLTAQNTNTFEPITAANRTQLQHIATLGRGDAPTFTWTADGETLTTATDTGIWFFDANFTQTDYWQHNFNFPYQIEWNPQGNQLAILDTDRLTVFFADGQLAFETDHPVSSFAWHPTENQLAIGTEDRNVTLLDPTTGIAIEQLEIRGEFVSWSPDGVYFAVSDNYTNLRLYDANTLELRRSLEPQQAGGILRWSADSHYFTDACFIQESFEFIGSCLWDAKTGELLEAMELVSFVWTPDAESRVTFGTSPFTADAGSFLDIQQPDAELISTGYGERLVNMIWHPQHNRLTALSDEGTLVEFDYPSGEIISQHQLHIPSGQMAISFSPSATYLSASRGGYVYMWSLDTLEAGFIPEPEYRLATQEDNFAFAEVRVDWISDEEIITNEYTNFYGPFVSRTINRRNANTGNVIERLYHIESEESSSAGYNCGESPNADYTRVACYVNHELRVYTFDLSQILFGVRETGAGREIAWNPDENTIAYRSYDGNTSTYSLRFYDLATRRTLHQVDVTTRYMMPAWNANLSSVAIPALLNDMETIIIAESETYATQASLPSRIAVWNPTGDLLAVTDGTTLNIWSAAEGITPAPIHAENIVALDWSADGRFIALAIDNGTIQLWGVLSN